MQMRNDFSIDNKINRFENKYRAGSKTLYLDNTIYIDEGDGYCFESEDNRLLDSDINDLVLFIENQPEIETVILSNNRIGDEGAKLLARLTTIKSLNLYNNSISDEGAKALAASTTLISLDVGFNKISIVGAKALVANTSIISLNLRDNDELSTFDAISLQAESNPVTRANYGRESGNKYYGTVPSLLRQSIFFIQNNPKTKQQAQTIPSDDLKDLINNHKP